jgi:hypothetical protein
MRAVKSRTTSLLAAVGAAFAVSAMIGAPIAIADPLPCADGQTLDESGNCVDMQPQNTNNTPDHPNNTGSGGGTGHGR